MTTFTTIEIQLIRASLGHRSDGEIAVLLERPIEEVYDKINEITVGGAEARSLGIQKQRDDKAQDIINTKQNKEAVRRDQKAREKKETKEKFARMQSESDRQYKKKQWESRRTYKTRVVNMEELIYVKIDSRTTVFVKPGSDIEKVRKQYTRPPLTKESFI